MSRKNGTRKWENAEVSHLTVDCQDISRVRNYFFISVHLLCPIQYNNSINAENMITLQILWAFKINITLVTHGVTLVVSVTVPCGHKQLTVVGTLVKLYNYWLCSKRNTLHFDLSFTLKICLGVKQTFASWILIVCLLSTWIFHFGNGFCNYQGKCAKMLCLLQLTAWHNIRCVTCSSLTQYPVLDFAKYNCLGVKQISLTS